MSRSTLGERLKRARQAMGLTQEALGQPDLTKGFISLLEHDRARPSVQTLQRLAERLGQPVSYFLDDHETTRSRRAAEVLGSRGRSELVRKRYQTALALFAEMRALAVSHRDARTEMYAVVGMGGALAGLGRGDEARTHLDEALARAREAADPLVECRALGGLGTVEQRDGHFPRAVSLYKAALAIAPSLANAEPVLQGELWLCLGSILARMGHVDEALDAHARARAVFDEAARPEKAGEVLQARAEALAGSAEYDAALQCSERACTLYEHHEDLRMTSHVRDAMGMLLIQAGRPREALDQFEASLAIKQRLQDVAGECHVLTELARCHFICGRPDRARELADRAISQSREARLPDEAARSQIVLGTIAAAGGDVKAAHRLMLKAAEHCEKAGLRSETVIACRELARLATSQGRYREAAAYQDKAFEALRGVGPHDVAAALNISDLMGRPAGTAPEPPARR